MKNFIKNKEGLSVLITVIVMSAVMGFVALFATIAGIDESQMSLYGNKASETFYGGDGCVEEALIKLHNDDEYSGENLFIGEVSCIVSVDAVGGDRVISVSAVNEALYSREIEVEVDVSGGFEITSWQEVID